jgi:hypothetical protein
MARCFPVQGGGTRMSALIIVAFIVLALLVAFVLTAWGM